VADETPSWPPPPREPGPWAGGPPVAPPGNTALPPLPGAGGVVHGTSSSVNPWGVAAPQPLAPSPAPGPAPFPGLPDPSARPLIDRAPTWILAVSAIIVVALIAGVFLLVTKGGRTYPSKWDPRVDPIARWVEKDRKLTYKHPVKVNFLTKAEYTKASTGGKGIGAGGGSSSSDSADQVGELRALGFVSGSLDLKAANKSLADSGTLAYYDQSTKQIYVRGTEVTPELRVTLAHELTHVLQDQYFDLTRIGKLDDDQATVLRALAEGDATHVEDDYVAKVLTPAERTQYQQKSKAESNASQSQLKAVPPVLTAFFAAPYILGPALLQYLRDEGGDAAVDKAFEKIPTEEELFNPLVYDTPASKPVKVDLEPAKGTKSVDSGTFGPTAWYLLLSTRMDPRRALTAVDGWGGDHYITVKKGGEVCVQADLKMDSSTDAREMTGALTTWASQSPAGKASAELQGGVIHFKTCDPGKNAPAVGDPAQADLLAVPATRTQAYEQVKQAGGNAKQAACFGQAIVTQLQPGQLNDEQYLSSPQGKAQLAQIGASCR
jgi:hypothetical protein